MVFGKEMAAKVGEPTVSVIMGVYNQFDREQLRRAVKSVLDQSFTDFEFIIYDDGSEPKAAEYITELSALDERIIICGKEENHGLAFSLNQCLSIARGKYIARMDADDISLPGRFEEQVNFLNKHTDVSWCGCNAFLFDEEGIFGQRRMPERPSYTDYLKYSPYIHPTVMYRKDVLDFCDGYSEQKATLMCEDYEIFMRLKAMGFYGANIQKELFLYRENNKSFERRSIKRRFRESEIRFRNFKRMGILFPKGWIYVLRPIAALLVPLKLVRLLKRKEAKRNEGFSQLFPEFFKVPARQ